MSRQPRMIVLLGVLTVAGLAASGCSAGQVTQTSTQVSTINGSSANIDQLALRNIRFVYPDGGSYPEGGTAELALVVTNQGLEADRLIDVTSDLFDEVALSTGDDEAKAGPAESLDAEVPAQGDLEFGTAELPGLEVSNLSERLSVSQVVSVTFVFELAGEVTVEVPVANPTEEIDRGEGFDFHEGEGAEG